MKAEWEVKPLEKCLGKFPVAAKIPKKKFLQEGNYPIISQESDFVNGYWNEASDVNLVESPVVIFGDHTQVLKYVDFDFVVGADGVKVLKPEPYLNAKFLTYFIEANPFPSLGYARHYRHVKSLPIPLPPLEEQKRIVAVLDAAFEGLTRARAHIETNLQNARELFAALLIGFQKQGDAVWSESALEELVSDDCTLSYGIVQPGEEVGDGQPIVRPTDLGEREIRLEGLKRINPEKSNSYARTRLLGGELLLCVRGTTGAIGIAASELTGANVTRGIVPIRFDPEQILQKFGYYAFVSSPVQKQISEATYGAALQQINIRDVRKLRFTYPNLEEQKMILDALDDAYDRSSEMHAHYRAKLQDLDDLRQSLLQKAFAGELT